jgi:hypothetical protein
MFITYQMCYVKFIIFTLQEFFNKTKNGQTPSGRNNNIENVKTKTENSAFSHFNGRAIVGKKLFHALLAFGLI